MPTRPNRGCAYGWCNRIAVAGEQYCEEHLKLANRNYAKYGRDPKHKQRYGHAWEKIRKRFVETHPYCEVCLEAGRLVPTEHVHHIIALSEGGTNDEDNLQALCKSCHSRIHAQRGDRWGRPNEYE